MKFFKYVSAMALAMGLALPVAAATGPWSWEDISAKIPVKRDGWRVTAVGHFGMDWYFTNGKAFASGGKVWKLWEDGKVTEVTGSLKKAGLTRVDSIASRASSISYLQTDNEGVSKAASWNGSAVATQDEYEDDELAGASDELWQGVEDIKLTAGNTDNGILIGTAESGESVAVFRHLASGQVRDLSAELAALPTDINWDDAMAAWNGASWMILANHDLIRFDGEKLTNLGRTRDKFTSVTAKTDGTYLLGGGTTDKLTKAKLVRVTEEMAEAAPVQSNITIEGAPELPAQQPAEQTMTPAAPAVTTFLWSIKPTALDNGKRMLVSSADGSYGVTATNANGLKKLELLVNGTVKNTCEATGKTQIYCRIYLKAADYAGTAKLDVTARATDANDAQAEGANETFWTE